MIEVSLPIPHRALTPNSRVHWSIKAKRTRTARFNALVVGRHALSKARIGKPEWPEAETRVVSYFRDKRRRDRDNYAASLKAYWDGLADAGIVANDAGFIHHSPVMDCDRKNPRVEIRINPVEDKDT